ncbi:hypothetical protein N431DRAFT_534298 [Stipitochalara longipes BDJ]|nr:hypothetical protein N431DRAFT_534298 [Stipitochalara longipes BDJ]
MEFRIMAIVLAFIATSIATTTTVAGPPYTPVSVTYSTKTDGGCEAILSVTPTVADEVPYNSDEDDRGRMWTVHSSMGTRRHARLSHDLGGDNDSDRLGNKDGLGVFLFAIHFRITITTDMVGNGAESLRIACINKETEMGRVDMPFADLLKAPNMTLGDSLEVGNRTTLRSSICLRVMKAATIQQMALPQRKK